MNDLERIGHLHMEAWRAARALNETPFPECENWNTHLGVCVDGVTPDEDLCETCAGRRQVHRDAQAAHDECLRATRVYGLKQERLAVARERLAYAQLQVDILSGEAGDCP